MAKGKTTRRKKRPAFGTDFDVGWVGFVFCPGRLLSQGIAYFTRRARTGKVTVSHAFLVTGPNECVEANLPAGVVTTDLTKEYFDRDDRIVLFRKPRGLMPVIARRVVARARAQVGARFDIGGMVAEGMHGTFLGFLITSVLGGKPRELVAKVLHQEGRWVCSELVGYCLREEPCYRGRGVLARPPGTLSPQELFEDGDLFEPSTPLVPSRRQAARAAARRTQPRR